MVAEGTVVRVFAPGPGEASSKELKPVAVIELPHIVTLGVHELPRSMLIQ